MILWQLGRLHIPLAFVAAFVPLSLLRAYATETRVLTELAVMTSPMFQLYIFFMITDPKTTTRGWRPGRARHLDADREGGLRWLI